MRDSDDNAVVRQKLRPRLTAHVAQLLAEIAGPLRPSDVRPAPPGLMTLQDGRSHGRQTLPTPVG